MLVVGKTSNAIFYSPLISPLPPQQNNPLSKTKKATKGKATGNQIPPK